MAIAQTQATNPYGVTDTVGVISSGVDGAVLLIDNPFLTTSSEYVFALWLYVASSKTTIIEYPDGADMESIERTFTGWKRFDVRPNFLASSENQIRVYVPPNTTMYFYEALLNTGTLLMDWSLNPDEMVTGWDVFYYQSTSKIALSGGTWTTTAPEWAAGKYMWSKNVTYYADGTVVESDPVCIAGKDGANGKDGADGKDGKNGKDAAVQSATEPADKSYMWLDISVEPPLLKRYNTSTASWEIISDTASILESIVILQENVYSDISKSAEEILSTVSQEYYAMAETDTLISEVSTELSQTKDAFEMRFTQYSADLEDVVNGTDAEFTEIKKYIRFEDGKILLGEVGNELELRIANDRMSFVQNNSEVAYFSNNKMYVTDGEYTHSLIIGNFAFMPRSNGNLSLKKIT